MSELRPPEQLAFFSAELSGWGVGQLLQAVRDLPEDSVALVLGSQGGAVTAARHLMIGLREQFTRVDVIVPDLAASSAAIAALGADVLWLEAGARLSPIDPRLGASKPGEVTYLSSEEIRRLPEMWRAWFPGETEVGPAEWLEVLAPRVFPGTLGALYRADRLVRQVARELIGERLRGELGAEEVIERLISAYPDHAFPILASDLRALGFNAQTLPRDTRAALDLGLATYHDGIDAFAAAHPQGHVMGSCGTPTEIRVLFNDESGEGWREVR